MEWLCRGTCLLLLQLSASLALAGEAAPADLEHQVKASYLYKFATYIEWPPADSASANAPLTIGLIGADVLGEELKRLSATHTIRGHPVQIRLLKAGAALDGLQILYLGQRMGARAQALLDSVANLPVLTITEAAGMLASGSIINLVQIDERIRFEVSLNHARGSGLRISSRLLDVAYRVEGTSP